jgi:hypothetical protein
MLANVYPQLGWLAPRPALTTQNPRPRNVIDPAGQNYVATTIAADREPTPHSTDQMTTGQDQMRNTDQTATGVDQAPTTKASNVTVESQGAASLQPAARLIEARPISATSGHNGSCFASASAVLQNHPGAWPTWTLKAPGHEGTMCWYAAARPRGSEHRPRSNETVGAAEKGLFAPFAPRGPAGSWDSGLP